MNGRGHGVLALVAIVAVVVAGIALDRAGSAAPDPAPAPSIASTEWFCPHGGGEGWRGSVVLVNPGDDPVDVRVTPAGVRRPGSPIEVTVPAARQLKLEVPAGARAASTTVEAFDGWVAASWMLESDDPGGLGAEPCAAAAARTWWMADPGTPQDVDAFLVVMNPFAVDAVVDVALFTADRAPIRDADWTDLLVPARRSVALRVDAKAEGEEAVLAQVDAEVGRIAAASLVVGREGGIRSAIGTSSPAARYLLPTAAGTGNASLLVGVPHDDTVRFAATLLSGRQQQPAGGLNDVEQAGASARAYPLATAGRPSAVDAALRADGAIAAALRTVGESIDGAATSGASAPAVAWIVPPSVVGPPSFPGLVLMNPGDRDVEVTLRLLPSGDRPVPEPVSVTVPASSAIGAPEDFLEAAPAAAVEVTAEGGEVVALGASTSRGVRGLSRYALVLGVPMPPDPSS